jgi:chemotaxis protein methyltransferase CheR
MAAERATEISGKLSLPVEPSNPASGAWDESSESDDKAAGSRAITKREFTLFQNLIHREGGIFLSDAKKALLVRRLGGRVRALGLSCFAAYYRRVTQGDDPQEMVRMLNCISTNETQFFREPKQFEFLENVVLPQWKVEADAGQRARRIRTWSCACSTGQEPYSLAMILLNQFPAGFGWEIEILASDISTQVLATAKKAVYQIEKMREIPEHFLKPFVLRGKGDQLGKIRMHRSIRSMVRFRRLNINLESYPVDGVFDLIFCRNVLIYFDAAGKVAVVNRLLSHLAPGGYLFVGHAESLTNLTDRVKSVVPTVYQVIPSER